MSYTALIIEPRKHAAMQFVLTNFYENLDERWNFLIYHGIENEDWMKELVNTFSEGNKRRTEIRKLDFVNILPHQYSAIMVNPAFIKSIPTEVFLVFQTDTMISSVHKDLIYNYMEYDYVGAPWPDGNVGNGGLSLRKRSKMLEIAEKAPYSPPYGEDLFFSFAMGIVDVYKPSFEKAKEFSIETIYNPISFGIHKAWRWTNKVTEEQCPGYTTLVALNLAYY